MVWLSAIGMSLGTFADLNGFVKTQMTIDGHYVGLDVVNRAEVKRWVWKALAAMNVASYGSYEAASYWCVIHWKSDKANVIPHAFTRNEANIMTTSNVSSMQ